MSKETTTPVERSLALDTTMFTLAVATALLVSVPLIFFSDSLGPSIIALYNWVALNLGLVFQWATIGAMAAMTLLIVGRHGAIKLGDSEDTPESHCNFIEIVWGLHGS